MKITKMILRIGFIVAGLLSVHALQVGSSAGYMCPQEYRPCVTNTSPGYCGFFSSRQDCNACYGDDGSILVGQNGCPNQGQ